MRRAALRHHSSAGAWRRIAEATGVSRLAGPTVSVLMATNRRRYLDLAIEQVAAQTYQNRELVLVLHGDEFGERFESDLAKRLPCPLTVVRATASEPLGVALNRGVEACSGDVLTKMDDDDWYGAEHVEDLVLALEYSGADLAGKGAEFIHLGDLEVTVRRWSTGSERRGKRVSGATLTLRKSDLIGLGGWRPVERAVDSRLQDDLEIAGADFYRCHGHGFIANRHGRGHTWDVDVDYFLRSADAHWRGVPFDAAGIAPGPAAHAVLEPASADAD
jgi:glycosyltransferase involved in cell wall biosynthesis